MTNKQQIGCKKCGAVVTVELQTTSDKIEVRVREGKVHDSYSGIEIQCKKCSTVIASVSVNKK